MPPVKPTVICSGHGLMHAVNKYSPCTCWGPALYWASGEMTQTGSCLLGALRSIEGDRCAHKPVPVHG